MKTRIIYTLVLSFLLISICVSGQAVKKIEGKVLNADTKEPVAYASIGLQGTSIGTITNEAGDFQLKLPAVTKNMQLCIKALSFKENCRPVAENQLNVIALEPSSIELSGVEVKGLSAESMVKEAIKRIPENYAHQPVRYTFYQRELQLLNDHPAYIIESVNEVYRDHPKNFNQLTIRKSRGMATSKKNQERMNNTWVSVYSVLDYDNILKQKSYLHSSRYKNYAYSLENETMIGNDTVYVVSFQPKPGKNGKEKAGQMGKIYLHHRSLAVVRLETKRNETEISDDNNSAGAKLVNKACKCTLTFLGREKQINYKQVGSRWYLDNAISEGHSLTTGDKFPTPERSHNVTQLVVTDIQLNNPPEIPVEQQVRPYRNHYSTAPKDMTDDYWQQYNVLPLPEAFKKSNNL